MPQAPKSALVRKGLPCPECSSSDAAAVYDDGHVHCFSCSKTFTTRTLKRLNYDLAEVGTPSSVRSVGSSRVEGGSMSEDPVARLIAASKLNAIKSRHLSLQTCERWNYRTRTSPKGDKEQIALYADKKGHQGIAAKIRNTGPDGTAKEFAWIGKQAATGLYGQWLWSPHSKLSVVVTEGEIDAMSLDQIQDYKWPVVSTPNGAQSAPKDIAKALDWLSGFKDVVFAFDMDEPGQEAAKECARMFPPGRARILRLPRGLKDINEALKQGAAAEVTKAFWNAQPYRPDGLIDARELTTLCMDPVVNGMPWPWKGVTDWTYGRRRKEVLTTGAGTGIGKSDFIAEIIAATLMGETKDGLQFEPEGFALFSYESGDAPSKKTIAGKIAKRRFHIPQGDGPDWGQWTDAELKATMDLMDVDLWNKGGKLFINKSGGLAQWEDVKERCRFARWADGITHFVIDPISALVVGASDQREFLDQVMMEMQLLSHELDATFYAQSHLTRPTQGPSHEEGGQVRLNQFRGSNGIGMSSSFVFGLERDTQAGDALERTKTTIRVVKDRYTGNSTGKTKALYYDLIHGTLDTPLEGDA